MRLSTRPLPLLPSMTFRYLLTGLVFSMLWASAGVASKFGLRSMEPLLLYNSRLIIAGGILLIISAIQQKKAPIPPKSEWKSLLIFGFLNTTMYLGCFIVAMKTVAAGIATLTIGTGPLVVGLISTFWLKRPLQKNEIIGFVLGILGVSVATFPLLKTSFVSTFGLITLAIGIISISTASVYYSQLKTSLSRVAFNGWQVSIGAMFMLPFTLMTTDLNNNNLNSTALLSILWLIGPVSIGSMLLWFSLLAKDPVRASMWLFLCPIFGFTYAKFFLNEPVSYFTLAGTILVVTGLYFGQRAKLKGV